MKGKAFAWSRLPDPLFLHILSYLPIDYFSVMASVCKLFNKWIKHQVSEWKNLYVEFLSCVLDEGTMWAMDRSNVYKHRMPRFLVWNTLRFGFQRIDYTWLLDVDVYFPCDYKLVKYSASKESRQSNGHSVLITVSLPHKADAETVYRCLGIGTSPQTGSISSQELFQKVYNYAATPDDDNKYYRLKLQDKAELHKLLRILLFEIPSLLQSVSLLTDNFQEILFSNETWPHIWTHSYPGMKLTFKTFVWALVNLKDMKNSVTTFIRRKRWYYLQTANTSK